MTHRGGLGTTGVEGPHGGLPRVGCMHGINSRAALLRSLGNSLLANPDVFGSEGRPGHLVGKASVFILETPIAC